MATKIFSLTNGNLILATTDDDATSEAAEYQLVRRPLRMVISEQGISLGMWMPCDMNDTVKIFRSQIVAEATAVEPLANEYRGKFGQVVTAPAGLVMP